MSFNNRNYTNYGATSQDAEVFIQPAASQQVTSMCESVSRNIELISNGIKYFTSVAELIGTKKDTNGLRDQILTRIMSSNHTIKTTQKDISVLSNLARSAKKKEKLQIQKLTGHFKDVVEKNCETQQVVMDKLRTNALWSPDKMMESSGDQSSLFQTDQVQLQKDLQFEQEMLLERQERIKQIETQILDAHEMMKELSALIHHQGTMVDTIETRVENVYENVQQGHQSLTSAADYASRARKKKLFLLSLLAVVMLIIIGVIIWSSTK